MNGPVPCRNALLDQPRGNACNSSPLSNRHALALELQEMIVPFVVALFFAGSPTTIFWLIIAVVIFSFNSVFICRWISHIRKKVYERFSPMFTNENPACAVIFPRWITWCITALDHAGPDTIDLCLSHPMCFICPWKFAHSATAASCSFGSQTSHKNMTRFSTIALTKPINKSLASSKTLGNEPPESSSGEVYKIRHGCMIPQHENKINTGVFNTVIG